MIFADKIIVLRKKKGLSQEELAFKLDVSRQSVSKWESGQSVPELDKLKTISKVFEISLDDLLDDKVELEETKVVMKKEINKISKTTTSNYLDISNKNGMLIGVGVAMCILSPIFLILFAGFSEYYNIMNEITASISGMIILIIMVAIAVSLFLTSHYLSRGYNDLKEIEFELEDDAKKYVNESKNKFNLFYYIANSIGIILCIIAIIPVLISSVFYNGMIEIYGVIGLFVAVAIGVFLIVYANYKNGIMNMLLKNKEYLIDKEKDSSLKYVISNSYWLVICAIYLIVSFITNNWDKTWIIWPVSALFYVVIIYIIKFIEEKKR